MANNYISVFGQNTQSTDILNPIGQPGKYYRYSDVQWSGTSTVRTNGAGFQSTASSIQYNTALRQASFISTLMAEIIVQRYGALLDDVHINMSTETEANKSMTQKISYIASTLSGNSNNWLLANEVYTAAIRNGAVTLSKVDLTTLRTEFASLTTPCTFNSTVTFAQSVTFNNKATFSDASFNKPPVLSADANSVLWKGILTNDRTISIKQNASQTSDISVTLPSKAGTLALTTDKVSSAKNADNAGHASTAAEADVAYSIFIEKYTPYQRINDTQINITTPLKYNTLYVLNYSIKFTGTSAGSTITKTACKTCTFRLPQNYSISSSNIFYIDTFTANPLGRWVELCEIYLLYANSVWSLMLEPTTLETDSNYSSRAATFGDESALLMSLGTVGRTSN